MWGGVWESVQTRRNLHSIQMFGNVTFVYRDVWKTCNRRKLHAGQELDDAVDKFDVKVVQNNETVGHLLSKYSRILWLSHVAEN